MATTLTVMALVSGTSCGPQRLVPISGSDASVLPSPEGGRTDGADVAAPPCQPPQLVGFAAKAPMTKGGVEGRTIVVRTYEDLVAAAALAEPLVIELGTLISAPAGVSQIRVQSDKTIRGTSAGAGVTGVGFLLSNVSNVIIQNLILSKAEVDDSITVNASHHVWIDHCDLSSDGSTDYDGLIDVVHGSDYVTISWCVLHDHRLASLVGHSANPSDPLEDPNHLTVTYHHNWFRGTQFYNPKVRFGTVHVFNNHYDGAEVKGIVSQLGAQVLVEGNFFRNVKVPMTTVDDESEGDPSKEGFILERGNEYEGDFASVITKIGTWTPAPSDYVYSPDPAAGVPASVAACAGPLFD